MVRFSPCFGTVVDALVIRLVLRLLCGFERAQWEPFCDPCWMLVCELVIWVSFVLRWVYLQKIRHQRSCLYPFVNDGPPAFLCAIFAALKD